MVYDIVPIEVVPGVQPVTDFTEQSTPHFTFSDKIRFVDGYPEKIGGWDALTLEGNFTINGCPRNVYSYTLNNSTRYIVGTHTNLYYILGNELSNITPLTTTTTALNNAFSSYYDTLGNDPVSVVSGSAIVTITDTAHRFQGGEVIQLSGSTAVGGIPAVDINSNHIVSTVTTNTYSFTVATSATSTATGGGAAVVRASRIITVSQTAHGYSEGNNIEITNAAASVGGITAGAINGLHRIQNVSTNEYDFETNEIATSSATNTGGTADVAGEIEDGVCDPTTGQGYGLGRYGVGLYGVSKLSASPTPPSIWSFDRFGDLVVFTRGTQTGLYSWASGPDVLPLLVSNAPTEINYVFVSNEIVVTLGASGVDNRLQWSDRGGLTVWTPTAENQAGQDDIEGAGEFISHATLRGFNLLFTRNAVYSFRYIGRPLIWETKLIDPTRGLIAQNARVVVNGICYWMGKDNFYRYRGGNVEIIPSNSTQETTLKDYVFDNLNTVQADKIFGWYNAEFNEIWWHYPSASSAEPDRVAVLNVTTFEWWPHTFERTAAEYPNITGSFPYLVDFDGVVYRHENGTDDMGASLQFTLTGPYSDSGTPNRAIGGLIFDSIRNGDLDVTLNTKNYPKGTVASTSYTVTDTTEKIVFKRRGRFRQYTITGNVIGQVFRSGRWQELLKRSGKK